MRNRIRDGHEYSDSQLVRGCADGDIRYAIVIEISTHGAAPLYSVDLPTLRCACPLTPRQRRSPTGRSRKRSGWAFALRLKEQLHFP